MRHVIHILIVALIFLLPSCYGRNSDGAAATSDGAAAVACGYESCTFGKYPYYTDGREKNIEWIVLDKGEESCLLLSRESLDADIFDLKSNVWSESRVRKFLNSGFYDSAFTPEEKNNMVRNNDTGDFVFLLSRDECRRFFRTDDDRCCMASPYALKRGAFSYFGRCWWWLRSSGYNRESSAYVYGNGNIYYDGCPRWDINGLRPAIRIKTGSLPVK